MCNFYNIRIVEINNKRKTIILTTGPRLMTPGICGKYLIYYFTMVLILYLEIQNFSEQIFVCFKGIYMRNALVRLLREQEVVGSILGRVIPKTLKMVPVATLLGAQH